MATKDIVTLNGRNQSLPTRRDDSETSPFHPGFTRGLSDWDQWFNSMYNRMLNFSPLSDLMNRPEVGERQIGGRALNSYVPAVNVIENENYYKVTAELPGIEPGDIELSFSRGILQISGEKKQETDEKEHGFYRIERSYGRFTRSVQLPEGVDGENIDASFKNGVLMVTLPKLPEHKKGARKIEIKSEEK